MCGGETTVGQHLIEAGHVRFDMRGGHELTGFDHLANMMVGMIHRCCRRDVVEAEGIHGEGSVETVYPSAVQKQAGSLTFDIVTQRLNIGAMSAALYPARPHPIAVIRNSS